MISHELNLKKGGLSYLQVNQTLSLFSDQFYISLFS